MENSKIKLAFVFPGFGSQWKKMGAGLLKENAFRTAIQACDKQFGRYVDWHIEEEIQRPVEISKMEDTLIGYPCSLAIEIALMELLKNRGIVPDAVIGHSGGETAAAYTAGVLNLKDTFTVIRNHHLEMERGAGTSIMAHIGLPMERVEEILKNPSRGWRRQPEVIPLFVSACNSPGATVVSGEREAIEKFVEFLTKEKIFCRLLHTLAPFHSPLMEQYREEIYNRMKNIRPKKASLPVYSSLVGRSGGEIDYGPSYWTEHMIKPVRFAPGIKAMIDDGFNVFVEISPHPVLSRNIKEILDDHGKGKGLVMGTLKRDEDESRELFDCLARLSIAGYVMPLERFKGEDKQRLQTAIASLTTDARDSRDSRGLRGLQNTEDVIRLKTGTPGEKEKFIIQTIKQSIREVLNKEIIPLHDIDLGFFEMGFDSLTSLKLSELLSHRLGLSLPHTLLFDYPDIRSLTGYLVSLFSTAGLTGPDNQGVSAKKTPAGDGDYYGGEPVAIIGMACRFPGGANNLESFWNLLKDGRDTVSEIPRERWNGDDYYSEEIIPGKSMTRRANFISGIDITAFDAGFFKISPREAESLDPQQRMLMEVTVEALENAAVAPLSIRDKKVGVFIGICMDDNKKAHLYSDDLRNIDPYSGSGSMFSPAAGRISYFLGIRGPSISVDTACSSSLTALHFAAQSLRGGECEMALVGGVNSLLTPNMFVYLTQLNTLSGDGVCKTFDEKADGFGRGEGCGVFVLKRLSAAREHNDSILAVIRGSAVNHDGASTGFTAPNGIAQQEVLYKALENAGVSPESVDYIETHGAGTPLGDPIEIGAIHEVYGKKHSMDHPVLVGAVKTNIGHLEGASGAAGVIKTVLALQNQAIPPHLHVSTPNPLIDWKHMPVKIAMELTPWRRSEKPRRAGISGFGFSGTNAHMIIEEAPVMESKEPGVEYPVHILNLSARSEGALKELVELYRGYLSQNPSLLPPLGDICYTASTGRSHYSYRFSVLGKNREEIIRKSGAYRTGIQPHDFHKKGLDNRIVFLYTGQGSHYIGMGSELYRVHPVFKAGLDRCDALFRPYVEKSIVDLLYSSSGNGGEAVLDRALYAQPVIFSIGYALTELWASFGVKPSAVIGHSIGEYAAACTAGVLTLEDAVKLVAVRGKLMQSITDPGRMVGILAPEEKVRAFIHEYNDVSTAAVNAPENVTISGSKASIEKVLEKVKQARIFVEHLNISHAFHSVLMEPYVEKLSREIDGVVFSPPELPIISTITGKKAAAEITDPGYWGRHICRTVRFYDCMKAAEQEGYRVYVEIGGTATLAGLAGQCIPGENTVFLPSLRKGRDQWEQLLTSLSQLYIHGIDIDWNRFYEPGAQINNPGVNGDVNVNVKNEDKGPHRTRKVSLPIYPFQRKRYWRWPISSPLVPGAAGVTPSLENEQHFQPAADSELFNDRTPMNTAGKNENTGTIRTELKEMVHAISGLNTEDFDNDTDLFSLGLDSLMLVELRKKIVGKYEIDISLNEFFMALNSLNKITGYIEGNLGRVVSPVSPVSFVSLPPGKSEPKAPPPRPLNFSSTVAVGKRGLSPRQQDHLERLIERYTQRTRNSKQQTLAYRHILADSKAAVGFNLSTKEMLYPIIGKSALGSRIRDIDDNEYVDITMGFGVYLFGHHPSFITRALREGPVDDTQLGPRSYLVGEVAELISRLTGMERVTFTNTGTEAVMAAIRLARAATGRTKIAMFSRSYHGHSDGTLAVPFTRNGKLSSEPVSPGIPRSVAEEVLVVDYLDPRSLEIIEAHSHQLAAVLVEPIQSRYPDVQPGEFLRQLRHIASRSGTALIFDEMITGFRLHIGGAQAYFNVEADLCTYGKIIGGGLPIGVIAGKAKYLDGIDGGPWNYGDNSYPRVERTFFGGTFCQYHEAMTAARAVLKYLEEQGPDLQNQLNRRTEKFAHTLNTYFEQNDISMRLAYFSSIFRFDIPGGMDLFFYHLLQKGVYIWEWRSCFLSTAHTDEDFDYIIDAVKESIEELKEGGFSLTGAAKAFKVKKQYYPMSSVQKRLYVLSQTEGGERAYHVVIAMRVHGALDVEKTESAFKSLIRRHEILRTGLEINDEQLVQRVYEYEEVEFSLIYRKSTASEENIDCLIEEVLRPFDLSTPPLMRVSITEISPTSFIFITNFHHSIMDGTSLAILVREFMQLYEGGELPPLKKQYKEYVQWEQRYIGSPDFRVHEAFWRDQLGGELPVLELPVDFPRPETLDFAGRTLRFTIGKEKTAKVKGLARETGTSLNMMLLAVFNVFLFKLTGQEDMCVGMPVDVRVYGDFDHTPGMFTNTLVLRVHPTAEKSFVRFLKETKIRFLQAYAHQEYPYEELVARLGNQRDIGHNPFFDVIFGYENGDQRLYKIPGLTFSTIDINPGASPFDLFFEVVEEEGHLNAGINYRTGLFKDETIERWKQHFETLMDEILKDPDSLLSGIDMLTESEKQKLLIEFNDTAVDYPKNKTLHQLFEEQAVRTPERIAVVGSWQLAIGKEKRSGETAQLTYKELNRESGQLAFLLKEKGVQPDTIVGLMVERSLEMIIGILGILKAGGAYLPIDPEYPQERIDYMLKDSEAKLLVTTGNLAKEGEKVRRWEGEICYIEKLSYFSYPLTFLPSYLQSPSNPAYVIYTSGTTGQPKGVFITHGNVIPTVRNVNYIRLSEADRVLQLSNYAFDGSVFDIFGALLNGSVLVLVGTGTLPDARRLVKLVKRESITVFFVTTALFNTLVDVDIDCFSGVRKILFGGERVSVPHVSKAFKHLGKQRMLHMYGPTETTVYASFYPIDEVGGRRETIPIGAPLSNTSVHILDQGLKFVPIGVVGEIYIGGPRVAPGYLNRPELTAERFIEYRSYRSYRTYIFYRTGDFARWLPDGNIEFLGRKDQQVKIRGFRIELAEIESKLSGHADVKDAVVIAREGEAESGDRRYLCAYIVSDKAVEIPALIEYLSGELPDYMIPLYFTRLDKIPLTPNGKIDRKALPSPEVKAAKDYIAPGNELEERLVEIWSKVLMIKKEAIGINSNFFHLGGHSLKAAILINKIHKEFGIELKMKDIFEIPFIKGISGIITGAQGGGYASVEPVEKRDYYPLSSAQKRLYIIYQMDNHSIGYNLPGFFQLEGEIEKGRLEDVFSELIERHESLRTSFHMVEDRPVQRIHDKVEFGVEYFDLTTENTEEKKQETKEILQDKKLPTANCQLPTDFIRPFDLSQAPLLRVGLIKTEREKHIHILGFDIHHIAADGISIGILLKDFQTLYGGRELPPLRPGYKDFSVWQNNLIASEAIKGQEEYWLNRFRDEIPALNLPTDYLRPSVQRFEGSTVRFEIGIEQTEQLRHFGLETGVTMYMLMLAVFNVFLSGLTGQEDIIVGSPMAGRRHSDFEDILGMFVNTLVLRNQPLGEKPFTVFLEEVKECTLKAFENQDYQYEELVERVVKTRDMSRNPLFDVSFTLHSKEFSMDLQRLELPGLKTTRYEYEEKISKFDMTLLVEESEESEIMVFTLEYSTNLFKKETIERFVGCFKKVLSGVREEPGKPVSGIELISDEEKQRVLSDFNDTAAEYPQNRSIHELFEEQAAKTPAGVSVVGGWQLAVGKKENIHIDYGVLNEKAGQLARSLKEKGVPADSIIGIMMERSVEMIIGILGILKAGGAYLPIDPGYPQERIDYMLKDSNAGLLVTADNLETLDFRRLPAAGHRQPATSLAYVIYTSGTTGKPKGVVITHGNVIPTVRNVNYIRLSEADRVLQLSNYAFDGSIFDIFGALLNGSALVLVGTGTLPDARRLVEFVKRENITVFFITTALFNTLVDVDIDSFSGVRKILFGGERVSVPHVLKAFKHLGKQRLLHMYGPTETTVYASFYSIDEVEGHRETIPIGAPLSNTSIYILDQGLKSVPIGIVGEIYIGGPRVTPGYLNRPELTAEKFIEYRSYRTYRTYISYKTGDFARWLPDGNIEFIGRVDQQVKIRGFRIELGEIESKLLGHDDVKDAVVIALEGKDELCAYIVSDKVVEIPALIEYLSGELPDFMIPSYFTRLDKIPLTPNGKIDRKALPSPEVRVTKDYIAPRNELEEKLVEIWSKVLKIKKEVIGIDANFFHLGGHSLKAAILINKIYKEFGIELKMKDIFDFPFIKGISGIITRNREGGYASVEPVEKKEYYALSSAQKRLYIIYRMDKNSLGYNMPGFFQLEGEIEKGRLEDVFRKLIKRHESLRTSFHMVEDRPVQRIHDRVEFGVEYFDLATENTEEKKQETKETLQHKKLPTANCQLPTDFIRPFDLSQAPLLRVGLIKPGKEKHIHILGFDIHHIAADGISIGVFLRDLQALYGGRELPPLRLEYKDFSVWQNRLITSEAINDQEEYWLNRFRDEIPALNLPNDYLRPSVQRFEGSALRFEIGKEQTEQLRRLGQETGVTMYMLMLAVFSVFLSRLTGQEDIIVGSAVSGRRRSDFEDILGMFVNTLALRNNPLGEKSFMEFLEEVKVCTLKAFENQDYQYEELVEKIVETRDMSRNPLFDVSFTLHSKDFNIDFQTMELPGLKTTLYEYEEKISKFDMSLLVEEGEESEKMFFTLEYSTNLFKKETIERFVSYFKKVLSGVLEEPGKPVSGIEIISDEEKQQVLTDFNDTAAEYPQNKSIHELFEEQAEKTPDRVAVVGKGHGCMDAWMHGNISITFRELNERSDRLAEILKEKGVLAESIAAIMVHRSIEMIIGILGILKAGGAYLPIDPGYPQERIDYMLKDSGAKLLVTTNNLEAPDFPLLPATGRRPPSTSLAYVIYTSGTTGRPKGVVITHGNVIPVVRNANYIRLSEADRVLQLSNYAFDGSVFDIFGALLNGSVLVLVGTETLLDARRLVEFVKRESITVFFVTTALFNTLVDVDIDCFSGVRKILFGGERVSVPHVLKAFKHLGKQRMLHMYGPTETTVYASFYPIDEVEDHRETIPIGAPLSNTSVYILDQGLKLVPIGVVGEIYIGGLKVAPGYLNRPELTAEKFDQDLWDYHDYHDDNFQKFFGGSRGAILQKSPPGCRRLYRTGDLARWLPDGNIEFSGRIDSQVKIRGYRIEPGEIENLLLQHNKINEAIVLVRQDESGDNYLCAYIVPNRVDAAGFAHTASIPEELKKYLSQLLPDYMIPGRFVLLEKMPLTPNGKVDRRVLPTPRAAASGVGYAPPRGEMEETLALLWSQVLGIEKEAIGMDDNFIELGGQSLKAIMLLSKIHKTFHVKLSVAEFFKIPVIRELSRFLKTAVRDRFIAVKPVEKKEYYALSPAQKRLYIIQQIDPHSTTYNMPMVLVLEGNIEREKIENTFGKLIERHESLRTSIEIVNRQPVQKVHEKVQFEIEYYDLAAGRHKKIQKNTKEEKRTGENLAAEKILQSARYQLPTTSNFVRPFDLSQAPYVRAGLIKTGEREHILMVDTHHIISDGNSHEILMKEFFALYGGETLPELKLQYRDFSEWQNNRIISGEIKKQEEFWLKEFQGKIPVLKMATDYNRLEIKSNKGGAVDFEIAPGEAENLRELVKKEDTTMFMVLLALFNIFLYKISLQEDIVIGTIAAGRRHADLENIIGMFVNTMALRNYPEGNKTFIEFLREVKKRTLDVFDNQDYQFEELVENVMPEREAGRNPLFDVLFSFSSQNIKESSHPGSGRVEKPVEHGLKIKSYVVNEDTPAKFDMIFTGEDTGENLFFIIEYNIGLFKKETIERFIRYFKEVTAAVKGNESIRLKDIKISHELVTAIADIYQKDENEFEF